MRTETSGARTVATGGVSVVRVSRRPTFDLVLATVGRVDEVRRLFASLERQSHGAFRVLLVDQNDDDRLEPLLAERRPFDVVRLRSAARSLASAQRRARARPGRHRGVPRRRLRVRAGPARARGRAARRPGPAGRPHGPGGRPRRALGAVLAPRSRRAPCGRPLEPSGLVHDLPAPRARSRASAASTSGWASALRARGRRARRSSYSSAPSGSAP